MTAVVALLMSKIFENQHFTR